MENKRTFWFVLILLLTLSACSSQSSGPSAWIDQPLNGSEFPLQPVILTAHASDSDGVASFEIYLADELLETVSAGGNRLGEAVWEWLPPGPGEYTLRVEAIDSQGNRGPGARVDLTITGPSTAQIDEVTPTSTPEETVPPVSNQALAKANTACRLGPDGAFEISGYLLLGESSQALGKLADSSWVQVKMPETGYLCWIAANQLEIDPALLEVLPVVSPPPLPAVLVTDTPAPDLTAPVIAGLSTSPDLILTAGSGCASYSRTTTVQASITDNLVVSSATAAWNVGGESGSISLTHSGGGIYQGLIGPVSTVGTMTITVQAWDSAGNSSSTTAPSVTVQNCIE